MTPDRFARSVEHEQELRRGSARDWLEWLVVARLETIVTNTDALKSCAIGLGLFAKEKIK